MKTSPSIPCLIDVTLREGGYLHAFSSSLAQACGIARSLSAAGIPIIEIGYFSSEPETANSFGQVGRSLTYITTVRDSCSAGTDIAVMVRPVCVELTAYRDLANAGVALVRLACQDRDLTCSRRHVEAARAAGLTVSINITHVSEYPLCNLIEAVKQAAEAQPDLLYLADSNGALFPDQTAELFSALKQHVDLPLGFHPHDGLNLAFANSLNALSHGATFLDASLAGLGKGGNLIIELVALYLNSNCGATFRLHHIAVALQEYVVPYLGDACLKRLEQSLASSMNLNYRTLSGLREELKGNSLLDLLLESEHDSSETTLKVVRGSFRNAGFH